MTSQWVKRVDTLIRQLQGQLSGKSKRSGTVTLTWPGGSVITTAGAVTHGLGGTPEGVQLTVISNPLPAGAFAWANAVGATQFALAAETTGAAPAGGTQCVVAWEVTG